MKIIIYNKRFGTNWEQAIKSTFPDADVWQWQADLNNEKQADYAVVWQPPIKLFQQQTTIRAVFNLGVGVDHLINLKGLPEQLPIYKLRGVGMEELMADYVAYGLMHFYRSFDRYSAQQKDGFWKAHRIQAKSEWTVGILGLGSIGSAVAEHIASLGFPVTGWSRSPKNLADIETLTGEEGFKSILQKSRVLVSLLPATKATEKLINHEALRQLPEGSVLINGGRGSVIDLEAVQSALDNGHLRGTVMDVFEKEPLDETHPLWAYPQAIITPHIAAPTQLEKAMEQIASYIEQIEAGDAPEPIDRTLGY